MSRYFFSKNFFPSWLAAIVFAGVLFLLLRPVIGRWVFRQRDLEQVLQDGENIAVGTQTVSGYTQIYYEFDNKKTFITSGNFNNVNPATEGEYVVWSKMINGAGQIQLYHIPTGLTLQLTNSRTNLNPQVNRAGQVVWESWIREGWQVFLFSSLNLQRITRGNIALHPDIFGDKVVFARKDEEGKWTTEQYSILDGSIMEIKRGIAAKYPKIDRDGIHFPNFPSDEQVEEEHALANRKEGDRPFFSLLHSREVSSDDIKQELENSLVLNSGQDTLSIIENLRERQNDDELIE